MTKANDLLEKLYGENKEVALLMTGLKFIIVSLRGSENYGTITFGNRLKKYETKEKFEKAVKSLYKRYKSVKISKIV